MPDMLRQPLTTLPLTFFDLETTGLVPAQGHRVCELALLRMRGTTIEARYSTLINPQRLLSARSFAVHGIAAEWLQDAPTFAAVADTVCALIQGSVLVAHNAPFDMAFLRAELARLDRPAPANPVLDTLVLARRLLDRSSYSLQALSSDLGLDTPTHRAMSDVLVLQGLFAYLQTKLHDLDIWTLGDVQRYQRGLLPGQAEPTPPPVIAQALHTGQGVRIMYKSRSSTVAVERVVCPRELVQEHGRLFLRAYCLLREDERSFAIDKIEHMELVALK